MKKFLNCFKKLFRKKWKPDKFIQSIRENKIKIDKKFLDLSLKPICKEVRCEHIGIILTNSIKRVIDGK